jgi:hypothetical protein
MDIDAESADSAGTAAAAPIAFTNIAFPAWLTIASVALAVLGLLLAILLFVAGILALRDSRKARKLHLWYSGVKIPLAAVSGVISAWMTAQFVNAITASSGGAQQAGMISAVMWGSAAVSVAIAWIYPIALLIVMNTRRVREYYGMS